MRAYDTKEFLNENKIHSEKDINNFLIKLGLNQDLISKLDIDLITLYLRENRMVVQMENDDTNSLYFTTGADSNNACLINIQPDNIKISEAFYTRKSNGFNQEGVVVTKIRKMVDNEVRDDSYALSLFFDNQKNAKLRYYDNVNDLNLAFVIDVDAETLDGKGEEIGITDTLNNNLALELFRKRFLQGKNTINNQVFMNEIGEDFHSIENGYARIK